MDNEKELLKLAGKLAIAAREVIQSNALNISDRIKAMENALNDYDNAFIENANE